MGALETNTTLIYGVHVRESANDGSDFTNAAADYRILFLGEDGLLHVKDSSGTVTSPYTSSGGTGQGLVDFGRAKRTAGDVTCSADAVWTEVDSGLRITLTAATADFIECGLSLIATSTDAVSINFTFMSVVGGTLTNDLYEGAAKSDTTNGNSGWRIAASSVDKACGSFIGPALQAGDISGGTVIVTLCYRTSSSTNRVIRADTTLPLLVWAKNLGPAM